ncbi:MAG: glycosyltransferase [Paracoccaceae bacterium]
MGLGHLHRLPADPVTWAASMILAAEARDPRLAILIPVFRHPVLLVDAIESVLAQRVDFGLRLILVNDGCPLPETEAVCRDYAMAHPGLITYLRKPNGGLSDARNHGIRHVLDHMPSVQAIYMLDADNRLRPDAMARAMAALDDDPAADWIYPNIDMFGLAWAGDYGGPYSQLIHNAMNICEAGSLIRRRVFEAGVMFDTGFRMGWEDWDFFLTAAEAGFRGRNLEDFGFLYRKRPESMLAESERDMGVLSGAMRAKHKDMARPAALLALEAAEAPRYAIHLPDRGEVILCTDPGAEASTERLSQSAFDERLWQALIAPGRFRVPPMTFVLPGAVFDGLQAAGLLRWVLWAMETALQRGGLAALTLDAADGPRMALQWSEPVTAGRRHHTAIAIASGPGFLADVVRDATTDWVDRLAGVGTDLPPVSMLDLQLPPDLMPDLPQPSAAADFLALVQRLRASDLRATAAQDWEYRSIGIPYRGREYDIVRSSVKGGPVWPHLKDGRRHIGFLLPIVEFGGVEKVALNMAQALRAKGWVLHAIVVESRDIALTPEWRATFESTGFLMDAHFRPWGAHKQSYGGTPVPDWATGAGHSTALGMLHWLDAVVNFHGGAIAGVMGELRRRGIRTLNSLHLNDQTAFGRPVGNTTLGLAYEHAFDLFVPCSHTMGDWLHGMGVPRDKIVVVPNAPGFALAPDMAAAGQAARLRRPDDGPLRVLFLGRLDRQKGLDRLTSVMRASDRRGLNIDWRVIGRALMAEDAPLLADEITAVLEPPLHRASDLAEVYAWADVMVLLSSFEGLPLTLLEAMRAGTVVLATDVGAVTDVLRDGENGVLLPLEQAVPACVVALERLAGDRATLHRLSAAAFAAQADHDWQVATDALADWLDNATPG